MDHLLDAVPNWSCHTTIFSTLMTSSDFCDSDLPEITLKKWEIFVKRWVNKIININEREGNHSHNWDVYFSFWIFRNSEET